MLLFLNGLKILPIENGFGIGMPLALSILKGQGGDIDVDFGGRGEGTTFILKFFK